MSRAWSIQLNLAAKHESTYFQSITEDNVRESQEVQLPEHCRGQRFPLCQTVLQNLPFSASLGRGGSGATKCKRV